ncbi:hemin uptake protein HemP [Undibacterium seohonense]|jgi:hemin uptake protein HemP|uniref:Hemin uptake protein HemP n=1 Tax=Undibacterium seohonense TaxID=1344950 RepID=A0ABR6X3D3_9BURK|nr:hemin uptake protein HemP [Undibacterium seohonense]MBC3806849.1 hemin uptake protein HemP [Undibacterium seohonense]
MNSSETPQVSPALLKPANKQIAPLRISSQDILQGQPEIEIEHQGMLYRLRCTSLGKLILTK